MKKLAYITLLDISAKSNGVNKKILAQCKAFVHLGYDVDLFSMTENGLMRTNLVTGERDEKQLSRFGKIFFYNEILDFINKNADGYDMAYLRQPYPTIKTICFRNFINKSKKKIRKVVLEMPTYPFLDESKILKAKVYNYIFRLQFFLAKRNIDLVTYMGALTNSIWGVKALRIFNSVDIAQYPLVEKEHLEPSVEKELRLIGVAQLAYWHGYDRIISGMADFYKNNNDRRKIYFDIVGGSDFGTTESELKELVSRFKLEEYVIFHGPLHGEALNRVFENSDIAVDSLGRHRSNNDYNCSLKSKEYCARGLPFIKSHQDDSFDGTGFYFQSPADESPIDIESLVSWFEEVRNNGSDMRRFAEKQFIWETQMNKVISTLS
jgi:glycosyltransferase involved in cell wall biosynthesis